MKGKRKGINASFAGAAFSRPEQDAIASANAVGVLVVAATGNGGGDSAKRTEETTTMCHPVILQVATSRISSLLPLQMKMTTWRHSAISVPNLFMLPHRGVDILSAFPAALNSSGYECESGKSVSAPYVSALAGLLNSYYPHFTCSQVRTTILRYVDPLPALQGRVLPGGKINAYKSLSSLLMPTNLTSTASTSSTISLAWTDNATGEDGYAVERDSGSGFGQVATLAPNATTYTDSGLGSSATYTYRVRAFNRVARAPHIRISLTPRPRPVRPLRLPHRTAEAALSVRGRICRQRRLTLHFS